MKEQHKLLKCKKCKRKTPHLKSGFGESGSLIGNGRWRCLVCETERK